MQSLRRSLIVLPARGVSLRRADQVADERVLAVQHVLAHVGRLDAVARVDRVASRAKGQHGRADVPRVRRGVRRRWLQPIAANMQREVDVVGQRHSPWEATACDSVLELLGPPPTPPPSVSSSFLVVSRLLLLLDSNFLIVKFLFFMPCYLAPRSLSVGRCCFGRWIFEAASV